MSQKKSIEQIWKEMEMKKTLEKKAIDDKERVLWEQREKARQEYLKDIKMYEKVGPVPSAASSAAGGGSSLYEEYISQTDTIWLYPQVDIDTYLSTLTLTGNTYESAPGLSPSVTFTRNGNVYSFPDVTTLAVFYSEVYLATEVSQPVGNAGYSLGVGTITRAKKTDRLTLKLDSGIKVIEWALMTQLTSQSSLPVGGNSPDGTVGWGSIYCDWDLNGIQDPNSSAAASISNLIDGLVFRRR